MFGLSFKEKRQFVLLYSFLSNSRGRQTLFHSEPEMPPRARTQVLHAQTLLLSAAAAGLPSRDPSKVPSREDKPVVYLPPRSTLSRISIRARGEICLPPPTPFFFVPSSQNALLTDQSHFRPGVVTGLTICAHCCAE